MGFKQKINKFFSITLNPFVLSRQEQELLLSTYDNPKNLTERSYFQFNIQFRVFPLYKRMLNNFFGLFSILYFGSIALFQRKSKVKTNNKRAKRAIFPYKNYHYPDVIPTELKKEFEIEKIDFMSGFQMGVRELKFIFHIWLQYPFQFYFLSKCFSKILFYRHIINNYSPDSIIVSSEYSFISSIATLYCRQNQVEHINITHGEHFYFVRDSFFEFDRFYVWDNFYTELFIKLKATPSQFLVGEYPSLKMNIVRGQEKYNYTYYLAAEDEAQLHKIKKTLIKLDEKENICIRFHPRYSKRETILKVFRGFNIEDPKEISLEQSFNNTRNVVSLYSACMTQAYFNDKTVVIDDVSHPQEKLTTLRESEYLIFAKPHLLASKILVNKASENV